MYAHLNTHVNKINIWNCYLKETQIYVLDIYDTMIQGFNSSSSWKIILTLRMMNGKDMILPAYDEISLVVQEGAGRQTFFQENFREQNLHLTPDLDGTIATTKTVKENRNSKTI